LACQDEFFVNNPLDVKENDEHALQFSPLPRSRWVWTSRLPLMLSYPSSYLFIVRVSVVLFQRFSRNLMHIHCSFVGSIEKSHQARYTTPNKRSQKISTFIQLNEILYTVSQDMLVPSSNVASRFYNCYTDGRTKWNYTYYFKKWGIGR
jgi:hypothetical protein